MFKKFCDYFLNLLPLPTRHRVDSPSNVALEIVNTKVGSWESSSSCVNVLTPLLHDSTGIVFLQVDSQTLLGTGRSVNVTRERKSELNS